MATESLKAEIPTDLDATPVVLHSPIEVGGKIRHAYATDEVSASVDAGSTYRMLRVRGDTKIVRLEYASDDLGTDVLLNCGLYDVTDDGVEDADFFASSLDVSTAAVGRTDITYESAVIAIENGGKMIFEQLGLSDTPENRAKEFDIYFTTVDGGSIAQSAGTIAIWLEYVEGQ